VRQHPFVGDHIIRRKHTVKAERELPGLVTEIVAPLQAQRLAQNTKLLAYQQTALTPEAADHAVMEMYRQDVIGVQRIADVVDAFERPPHDWGDKTAWRLFNAATFALAGKVAERPDITKRLHTIIDGTCQRVH
jgi:hypothetical protein